MLGSINLSGIGRSVFVSGNYAYVAETGTTQLEIIEVTNGGSSLSIVGQAQLNGSDSSDIFINASATRAYISTITSATQPEFFIVDISSKTGPRPVAGSYDTSGMSPRGITVVPGNKAIIVGTGGQEYQVIDITNENSPVACGPGLNIDSGVNGVAGVIENDGDAFAYIITGDANAEFKIIEGGPGGQFGTEGTYTSPALDAGRDVAFNRFFVNHIGPQLTSMQYEVAIADAVNNSCSQAVYSYAGPFASSSAIPSSTGDPNYKNPGRCMKYRVSLSTTEILQSPVLFDITFNYSP
jgi:hypothetical protein